MKLLCIAAAKSLNKCGGGGGGGDAKLRRTVPLIIMWPIQRDPVFFLLSRYYVLYTIIITYSFHWPIADDRPTSHPPQTWDNISFC